MGVRREGAVTLREKWELEREDAQNDALSLHMFPKQVHVNIKRCYNLRFGAGR